MNEIKWNEEILDAMLTKPSDALIRDLGTLKGDIMILGAGGKMGPDMAILAKRASPLASAERKVYAVSRFSDSAVRARLESEGVTVIPVDMMNDGALASLPDCDNIVFMAGKKFGTTGNEYLTWAMNTMLPDQVVHRFPKSSFVVFSSGNCYPKVSTSSGGATEKTPLAPVGDYTQSCLGRERVFEYAAKVMGAKVAIMRLNYSIDLRYGVLHDIAQTILQGKSLNLSAMPSFNCIWQKDANEAALRLLLHTSRDVFVLNVTGPETAGVRDTAEQLGAYLNKEVSFVGEEAPTAYLNNASNMYSLFGYPTVSLNTMIRWQAEWILSGGRSLGKPTHFEEREGKY